MFQSIAQSTRMLGGAAHPALGENRVSVSRIWAPEARLKVHASHSICAAEKTLDPTATRESRAEENQ